LIQYTGKRAHSSTNNSNRKKTIRRTAMPARMQNDRVGENLRHPGRSKLVMEL
jgi:hypothetical protein